MSTSRKVPTRIVASAAAWCPTYRHPMGWRSRFGSHPLCAKCHPPAVSSLVIEWLQRDPATREGPSRPVADVPRAHALLTDRAETVRRERAAKDFRRQLRGTQRAS